MDGGACVLCEVVPELLGGLCVLFVDECGEQAGPVEDVRFGKVVGVLFGPAVAEDDIVYLDVVRSVPELRFVECAVEDTVGLPVLDWLILLMEDDRGVVGVRVFGVRRFAGLQGQAGE